MYWHETLYQILNSANNIILMLIGIPFFLQLIYMLLFWVKKTVYPKSEKKAKIGIIISARNEEAVIYDTVKRIIDNQKYPRELFDILVIAHNCTDRTAELAAKAGAIVKVLNNDDPKDRIVATALNFGYKWFLDNDKGYDFFLRFDADNHINDEFLSLMNDAYQAGVEFGRPYESGLNMTQNGFAKACGLYYVFDSRFSGRVRERFGFSAHVNGPGMMISKRMLIANGNGFNCHTITEDSEFCFKKLGEGYYAHFVEDAVVYEDLPSTFKDTYKRNLRLGAGNIRLIKNYLFKLAGRSFTTMRFSYMEMFLTFFFNIICFILCTWIPLFYVYDVIYLACAGNGIIQTTLGSAEYLAILYNTLTIAGIALGILFLFCGFLQGFILIMLDYKKMGAKRRRDLISGAFLFPAFTVVYCLTIAIGLCSKPKWGQVARNKAQSFDTNK